METKPTKWIVSETFTYEVEASDADLAIKKVQDMSLAERTRVGHDWGVESWWTESRKDEIANLILEALEKKFGKWPAYDEKGEKWWAKAEQLFKKQGWSSDDYPEKWLYNDDDGTFCIHPEVNEPKIAFGLIHENENVNYVEMDADDALRILAIGVPF